MNVQPVPVSHALVCAPHLPEYDREAGAARLLDLILQLEDLGYTVTFVAKSPIGGIRYIRELQQRGIATYVGFGEEFDELLRHGRFELALCFFWYTGEELIPRIRTLSPSTFILIESVDLHFVRNCRQKLRFERNNPNHLLDGSLIVRELTAYANADGVLTVSQKEADTINEILDDENLAYAVPDFQNIEPSEIPFYERVGILFIGNFRHPPNVDAVSYLCREIVPQFEQELLAAHPISIVGNRLDEAILDIIADNPYIRPVGWVPSVLPYLEHARVSIVPLRYGAGTKRKLLQSMLVGTPAVSSSIGIEGMDIDAQEHLLVADDPKRFAQHVSCLLTEESLWTTLSNTARNHIISVRNQTKAKADLGEVISQFDVAASAAASRQSTPSSLNGPRKSSFHCNICGAACRLAVSQLDRDHPSCWSCGSTARFRAMIHVLSLELFGEAIPLIDFPERKDIRGIGLTDWPRYAEVLSEKFDYQNTFLHMSPCLDITADTAERFSEELYDFIICSDVLEHVAPPVNRAFVNLRKLLKPDGVAVVSVPYHRQGATKEHFPQLCDYHIEEKNGRYVLYNTTADGQLQEFRNLVFHGGPGETLEMRRFGLDDLLTCARESGFSHCREYRAAELWPAVRWPLWEDWSLPLALRKEQPKADRLFSISRSSAARMDGPPPVFIVGQYKCGSTWLLNALCAHPQLVGVREFDVIQNSCAVINGNLQLRPQEEIVHRFFRTSTWCMEYDGKTWSNNNIVDLLEGTDDLPIGARNASRQQRFQDVPIAVSRHLLQSIRSAQRPEEVIDCFLATVSSGWEEKAGIVLKAADQLAVLEHLQAWRPYAKKIVITRDGRDAAISANHFYRLMQEKQAPWYDGDMPDRDYWHWFRGWLQRAEQVCRDAATYDLWVLRYEDLCRDFQGTIKPLLLWLGVDADETTLQALQAESSFEAKTGRKPGDEAKHTFRKGVFGEWKDTLTAAEKSHAWSIASETLLKLGYTESGEYLPLPTFLD